MTNQSGDEPMYPPPGGPPVLTETERTQRNLVIGLSIGAAVVLVAGVIAFAATRGGGGTSNSLPPLTVTSSTAPATTSSSTTSTTAAPATTDESTTTVPIVANADAGTDLAVDRLTVFTLTANAVAEGTPDAAVRWTQTAGPDVTEGVGTLSGPVVTATAPADVSTLAFVLEVAGTGEVATDDVIVRVFEDADQAVFVDGELGADNGVGSIDDPFLTLAHAVDAAAGRDVYVRSVGTYDSTGETLELTDGMSLYGGFDVDWNRDVSQRAVIDGAEMALSISGPGERWISAIEVTSDDAVDFQSVAIAIDKAAIVHIEDSRVVAGDGADADTGTGGPSIGILADVATELRIERSTVNAGRGGDGSSGAPPGGGVPAAAAAGSDANGRLGGVGGGAGPALGGTGGSGGETSNGDAGPGGGGAGGTVGDRNGGPGPGGVGGIGGAGGDGGSGVADAVFIVPIGADGEPGADGTPGSGGRGGGGGFGPLLVAGGGGGGGGAGGNGSGGAPGGGGAGGSVGIWATDVDRLVIVESLVAGGAGGTGGTGFVAASSQAGGRGGAGANGVDGLVEDGGDGGGAGGGGAGGVGGQGGGGAGGPSYGMLTAAVSNVEVSSSTIRGGAGGNGGAGGTGGVSGQAGADGSGQAGGAGGNPTGLRAAQGAGASGGSSYGWFDESGAVSVLDGEVFDAGTPGFGGTGSPAGGNGLAIATNV
jgi:hypothetical protein